MKRETGQRSKSGDALCSTRVIQWYFCITFPKHMWGINFDIFKYKFPDPNLTSSSLALFRKF